MKKTENRVQISGGKYRGRVINLPNIETTRPSKSIVRNSIFDTLQNDIINRPFIEMFAGSGSVGFEAISRGTSKTYFLEMNKLAIQTIRKNSLNFVGENLEIVSGDSFQNIEKVLTELQREAILYVDPPFSIRDGMGNIYLNTIKKLNSLDVSKIYLIIVEHLSDEVFPEEIATKKLFKSRKFGKTSLSYFK